VGLEALADLRHPLFAGLPVVGRRADLDELVGLQRAVDLRGDLVRKALVADDDEGIQLVRLGAQFAAARGCEG
jgi:hypothetical protein